MEEIPTMGVAMFVKKTKTRSGRIYLSLAQGYRIDGKSRTRTIESLGYLDELEGRYGDPIAHFKKICDEHNAEAEALKASQTITIHPAQKIDIRTDNRKNIGCAIPLFHYNTLGIEKVLRNAMRRSKATYDINAIMRLLVMERILDPGSKRAAHANKGNYFFKSDFTDDDIYRSLDVFAKAKKSIIGAMNRAIEASGRRDVSHVFYDVTNYYFEIEEEDELRRRGVEKNKRPDPIVQMGLLQDANAIPLGFEVFSGNTNDCLTLLPVLKDLKEELGLKRVIVVADKGINTSDNIAACTLDENGFVFSQSIRGTKSKAELRKWVLSDSGYKENDEGTFKIKSRQDTKTLHLEGLGGKIKDVDVDIKVVAYWSAKYEARSRKKRAETIEKAKKLVKNPSAYTKAMSYGAAKYVKNITFDKKTGEILEDARKHAELDLDAIALEEACDGYYCIITSETHLADEEIIDIYKGLWKIEDAFRITKTDILTRPIYVSEPEHIKAHFLTCYIALTIIRLMQADLGFAHSASTIIDELSCMSGTHEQDNWWLFDHRTELSDLLAQSVGIDLARKRMQLSEIKGILTLVNGKPRSTT
jgi:transposase